MRPVDWRKCVSLTLLGLVLAACGNSSSAVSNSPETTSGPSASIVPISASAASSSSPTLVATKGPPTAQFSITGTAGLTGPVTTQSIGCNKPSLDGPEIDFIGKAGANGPMIVIFARAGHAEVRVGTGAASTLRLRTFVGSGVTSFDAATATGDLGALRSISGTIDCGNQQPGSANVVVSGPSPYGQLAGALTDADVTCTVTASGTYVGIVGLSTAGTTPVLLFVTASTALLQVSVGTKTAGTFYTAKGSGLTTLVPGGATIAGDVMEAAPSGSTPSPNLLHVTGSATCGTTIQQ